MSDTFKARLRRHPLAPKAGMSAVPDSVAADPVPAASPVAATVPQPAFEIPVDAQGNPDVTLDALAALSRNGDTVPMPVSRDMTDKELAAVQAGQAPSARLTKLERDTYMKLGWRDGDPIPPDFAAELKNTFSAYVAQKRAEGIPLDRIRISRIEDLPEEEQVRMRTVMQSLIRKEKENPAKTSPTNHGESLAAYPDHVRQVLSHVDLSPSVSAPFPPQAVSESVATPPVIGTDESTAEPDPLDEVPQGTVPIPARRETFVAVCRTCGRDPAKEKQRLVCSHCSCDPLEDPDGVPIPLEDKRRYLIALGSKQPFQKEYMIFHETIQVRFRSLGSQELDELTLWAARTVRGENVFTGQDLLPRIRAKELLGSLVLQTTLVRGLLEGSELFWAAPEVAYPTWNDWQREYTIKSMDELVGHFLENIPAEAVILALQDQMIRFNLLDYRLGREGNNTANFWTGT